MKNQEYEKIATELLGNNSDINNDNNIIQSNGGFKSFFSRMYSSKYVLIMIIITTIIITTIYLSIYTNLSKFSNDIYSEKNNTDHNINNNIKWIKLIRLTTQYFNKISSQSYVELNRLFVIYKQFIILIVSIIIAMLSGGFVKYMNEKKQK